MEGKIGIHSTVSTTEARASRFPYSLTPRPPVSSGLSTSSTLPSWMGSPSRIPAAPLIFALSSLQVPGPLPLALLLAPLETEGLPQSCPSASEPPGQQGRWWVSQGRVARWGGSLVGKQSWEVSQRELSADGFVISHKTGAFRFVNQSRLSRRMNVRFIGSKKALHSRSGACLFEHGHSQDPKRVWAF